MDVLNRTIIDGISTDEQEKLKLIANMIGGDEPRQKAAEQEATRFLLELANRASFDGWKGWPETPEQKQERVAREAREREKARKGK